MDTRRRNRPPDRRPLGHPMTDPARRDPISVDGVVADEQLVRDLAAGRRRPGDLLAELLGDWLDDINTDQPEET